MGPARSSLPSTAKASSATSLPMPSHAKRYGRRRLKGAITNAQKGAWDAYADANARQFRGFSDADRKVCLV
jgi:hypothetical protein